MSVAPSTTTPYALIKEIEARSRTRAMGLPQQVEVRRTWSGIGFRVGDLLLVSSLGQISEILVTPRLTRLPHAREWVKGVSNIRGALVPIIDLRGFIEDVPSEKSRRLRTLVVHHDTLSAGLMVDEAMGLRHFFDEERVGGLSSLPPVYKEYVSGGYKQGNTQWGVFDMEKLVTHKRFLDVAARL